MSNLELKIQLAKMLPNKLTAYKKADHDGYSEPYWHIDWLDCEGHEHFDPVHDNEWLHIVWLAEQGLKEIERINYTSALWKLSPDSKVEQRLWNQDQYAQAIWTWLTSASWQDRARALCKVIGLKDKI